MAISTLTTFNDFVNAEVISDLILEEAREQTFMPQIVLNKDISGSGSTVYNFARLASVAAAGLTEGVDMSSTTASSDAAGALTVAEVGVRVDVSDKLTKTTNRITVQDIISLCARALAAKIDTDLTAVFASASASVGATGVDLSLQNIEDGLYTLKLAQAAIGNPTLPGTPFGGVQCVLHTRQASDFRTAMRAANLAFMTPAEMGILLGAGSYGSGLMGVWQGVTFWESTKPALTGDSADRIGAIFVPRAIGFVTSGGPTVAPQRDESLRSTEINMVQLYAAGEVSDPDYVKVVTDA